VQYFARDDAVLVRTPVGTLEKGQVVLDTGNKTIVVTRNHNPAHARRVARSDVSRANGTLQRWTPTHGRTEGRPGTVDYDTLTDEQRQAFCNPKTSAPKRKHRSSSTSLTSLQCLETAKGWCALQAQARPVSQAELIEGVWTTCGTWVQARTKPTPREPSCDKCRSRLKMGAKEAGARRRR